MNYAKMMANEFVSIPNKDGRLSQNTAATILVIFI